MARKKAAEQPQEDANRETAAAIINEVAEATKVPEDGGGQGEAKKPGRGWTERYVQPGKYRRFTARDASGKNKIMFKFDLPAGADKPADAIMDVVRAHKKTDEGYPTGLHFEHDHVYGKVWKVPDTEQGRAVADSLDQALDGVAKKLEAEQIAR